MAVIAIRTTGCHESGKDAIFQGCRMRAGMPVKRLLQGDELLNFISLRYSINDFPHTELNVEKSLLKVRKYLMSLMKVFAYSLTQQR
jgi:hypothetical protein